MPIETLEQAVTRLIYLSHSPRVTPDARYRQAIRIVLEELRKMTKSSTARRLYTFHRCPNTGAVLVTSFEDDKALCRCGLTNPNVPLEEPGVHVKQFLEPAPIEEFLEQEKKS
jgi:hypothetical protein